MSDTSYFDTLLKPLHSAFEAKPFPDALFHYTDTAGVLGIAGGNTLWATNALFLNDEGEIRHTAALVTRLYNREIERERPPENRGDITRVVRDFLHRINYLNETGWFSIDAYVVCFCEAEDLLSQWRGYGDQGGGFSIGFNPRILLNAAETVTPNCEVSLGPILYCEREQSTRIEKAYDLVRSSLMTCAAGKSVEDADPEAQVHAEAFLREVFLYAPFFKQQTFSEEREWRMVFTGRIPHDLTRFRQHPLGPVPYIEIPLTHGSNDSAVTSLRIGPRKDHALAHRALTLLLRGRHVKISSSEVTLR
jgi:hypothetical protein